MPLTARRTAASCAAAAALAAACAPSASAATPVQARIAAIASAQAGVREAPAGSGCTGTRNGKPYNRYSEHGECLPVLGFNAAFLTWAMRQAGVPAPYVLSSSYFAVVWPRAGQPNVGDIAVRDTGAGIVVGLSARRGTVTVVGSDKPAAPNAARRIARRVYALAGTSFVRFAP